MNKPSYDGNGILNLTSSIVSARGGKTNYKNLKLLPSSKIKNSKNIVLLLIDGLGYDFLMKNGKNTIFNENLKGKMTSTFPSSTSAAMSTLMTAVPPIEHGMTGWHMYLNEYGVQIISLPYQLKISGKKPMPFSEITNMNKLFNFKSIFNKVKTKSYLIQLKKITNSDATIAQSGNAKRFAFNNIGGCLKLIKKIIKSNNQKKFIFAYYPDHDSMAHDKGIKNKEVLNHFKKLDKKITSLVKSLKGTDTTLIITADHGHIDTKHILLENHPKLKETLRMPLCGETRFPYCYIKPEKEKQFKNYIKTKMKKYCTLHKPEDFIKQGFFGPLKKIHPKFKDRIGDYILIMKENYALYEKLPNQKEYHFHKSDHGGLSDQELYVPLIVINN